MKNNTRYISTNFGFILVHDLDEEEVCIEMFGQSGIDKFDLFISTDCLKREQGEMISDMKSSSTDRIKGYIKNKNKVKEMFKDV